MSKKIVSICLTILMLITMLPMATLAAEINSPSLSVDSADATPGDSITVSIKLKNNPGIVAGQVNVAFDSGLTLTGATKGDAFPSYITFTMPKQLSTVGEINDSCNIVWGGTDINAGDIKDGTVLTLTFRVSEEAEVGDMYNITVTPSRVNDKDLATVELNTVQSRITIIDYTPGDVNDDGIISMLDTVLISRFIVDGCTYDPDGYAIRLNEKAADVNDDGIISMLDTVMISRYIVDGCKTDPNGYNIELKGSTKKCQHEMQAFEAKAATCTEDGNIAYWYCGLCEKYFADVNGSRVITYEDTVIAAVGHTPVIDPEVPATYDKTGLTEGSHCSVCGEVIVRQEEIPVLQSQQHHISYDIANGDPYIEKRIVNNELQNSNPDRYNEETGLTLKNLSVPGYRFLGWYDGAGDNATQIKKIEAHSTDDYELYAHWEVIEYTVQYSSSLLVERERDTYTVNSGLTLPSPKLSNYYFLGWSGENGKLVKNNVLPVGTTGNITLYGNWTSERNKTWTKPNLSDPVIHVDEENNVVVFAYEIGKIENVPLYTIKDFGYIAGDGVTRSETATYQTTVSESNMQSYARAVSNATTQSSSWTLSDNWNDIITIDEGWCQTNGVTTEEAESFSKSETNTWNISSGTSGSTDTTHLETNQNGWEAGGKVTENRGHSSQESYGRNAGLNANLGFGGNKGKSATADGGSSSATVTGGTTINGGIGADTGASENKQYNYSWNAGLELGRNNNGLSITSDTTVSRSGWNKSSSYGGSNTTSSSSSTSKAVSEEICKKYGYGQSYANGGSSTDSQGLSSVQSDSDEYSSSVTYSTSTMNSVTSSWTTQATKPGYHRWIVAGTAHVFGVVGYDMSSQSYFVYTYSVMDDETHEFEDYSYSTASYDDQQNGVIPFEIPYEVAEYVTEMTAFSAGLKINQNTGIITGYTRPEGSEDNIVVIPEYMNVGNGDVVKVTGISSNAFRGNTDIEAIVFSTFITEIPDNAFEGCTSLSTIIGGSITRIGEKAFSGCTSIDVFGICNLVEDVGDRAFEGVQALTVNAANANVVNAAVNSGAKIIDINVGYIENGAAALSGVTLTIPESTEMFSFNGYKRDYNNFSIVSHADETRIHKTNFISTESIPLKLYSHKVILNQVTIQAAGLGLALIGDNTELGLQGNVTVTSDNTNAVLCKNTLLYESNENVEGTLIVNDKILVCGDVSGRDHLQYKQYEQIDSETFENLLNSYTLSFNVNASDASCSESSRRVSNSMPIGNLPTPTRTGFNFDGWYTAVTGGNKVSATTIFTTASDVTLYAHWTVKSYTASWSTGTGYSISVKRTSSPKAGASTGTINSGATVYYGDVLSVTYTASTGYTIGSKGSTSITVNGNVTSSNIYATATVNSYKVSWNTGTGYTIAVNRTSSPKGGASTGALSNGATIYYGDVLSVTYTASTGYSISSKGSTSITVTGNVTSSNIYATAKVNSYTYNIVYKSSNGTDLGSSTATYNYGTTNTISAPAKSGYDTPGSQSVKWDSTSPKTITFTYTPTAQPTRQTIDSGRWWTSSSGNTYIDYKVEAEWRNRTANSVEIRIIWTNTIVNDYNQGRYGYKQEFEWWGMHQIAAASEFNTAGGTRSASNTSGWHTYSCTPDDISQNTGSYWQDNNGKSGEWGGTVYFPKY